MSLANLLAQNMGSKLKGDSFDTVKEDKKSIKKPSSEIVEKSEHRLVFSMEKRRGKPVTLVGKFYIKEEEKKTILKTLKGKLACGGAIKDEYIELQGDIKDKIRNILQEDGWKFKN